MSRDVFFADGLEGIVVALVRGVAGKGSAGAVRREEFLAGHAVVDRQQKPALEAGGKGGEEFALAGAEFGNEILGRRGPVEIQNLGWREAEGAVEELDALEFPAARAGFDDFKGQGVEEFVGKMDSGEIWQILGRFDPIDAPTREAGLLFFAKRGERLDDDQAGLGEGSFGKTIHHIGSKAAVIRALLDQREILGTAEDFPHFEKLGGEDFAEDRAEADVRKKIAIASHARLAARVVTLGGIVEGQLHEAREAHRAVAGDFCGDAAAKAG